MCRSIALFVRLQFLARKIGIFTLINQNKRINFTQILAIIAR